MTLVLKAGVWLLLLTAVLVAGAAVVALEAASRALRPGEGTRPGAAAPRARPLNPLHLSEVLLQTFGFMVSQGEDALVSRVQRRNASRSIWLV